MDVSLQLYSIYKETAKDFAESVKKVSSLGYDGVEFAGYGGLSADEMKALLKESNLYSVGSHSSFDVFENSFDDDLAFHQAIGSKYIVCPGKVMKTREDIDHVAKVLNAASEKAKKVGIKVGYHNHAHEFEQIDGEYILDLLAKATNEDVILEVDVYWVAYAGVDPLAYIEKWGKKVELVHLKQIGEDKVNVDLPDGSIDMKKVIETARFATYFVVEQEDTKRPTWDSMKVNVDYLKSL